MPQHDIRISYQIHSSSSALAIEDQFLIAEAIKASALAYAPYSKFKVGTAFRTKDNNIVIGSNQENGAFPIGQCAERVALYNMVHHFGREPIDSIAIAVDSIHQVKPSSPCGSCRQILNEYRSFQDTPIRVLLAHAAGGEVYEIADVKDLLPFAFDGAFLGL